MRTVTLAPASTPSVAVPALGLGTWRMGESKRSRTSEVEAVVHALKLGYRLIDTAEMYGEGGAEEIVGAALQRAGVARSDVFVVSKVYPHNASRAGVQAACRRSLQRLGLAYIDLYLLHWRGQAPLAETVAGFEALQRDGLIRHWGVSNFDVDDMAQLWQVPGGDRCATNQVYYSLSQRGIEFDLLPWLRAHGVPAMAYSPIDQGPLAQAAQLKPLAQALGCTPGATRARVGAAPGRRDRNPQGGTRCASARQPGGHSAQPAKRNAPRAGCALSTTPSQAPAGDDLTAVGPVNTWTAHA